MNFRRIIGQLFLRKHWKSDRVEPRSAQWDITGSEFAEDGTPLVSLATLAHYDKICRDKKSYPRSYDWMSETNKNIRRIGLSHVVQQLLFSGVNRYYYRDIDIVGYFLSRDGFTDREISLLVQMIVEEERK